MRYSCETCQGFVSFADNWVVGDCSHSCLIGLKVVTQV